jgi:hypothetical protein
MVDHVKSRPPLSSKSPSHTSSSLFNLRSQTGTSKERPVSTLDLVLSFPQFLTALVSISNLINLYVQGLFPEKLLEKLAYANSESAATTFDSSDVTQG